MLHRGQDRGKGNPLRCFTLIVQFHADHYRQAGLAATQHSSPCFSHCGNTIGQQQPGTQRTEFKALLGIAGREIPDAPRFVVLIAERQTAQPSGDPTVRGRGKFFQFRGIQHPADRIGPGGKRRGGAQDTGEVRPAKEGNPS